MIRLTRKVFHDLAIWMIAFGLLIGVVFPFFVVLMGFPFERALSPTFFLACMAAGCIVGSVNIGLARSVVGQRLRRLAGRMQWVENHLKEMKEEGALNACTPEACSLPVDSEDEIGESARAFNHLVEALSSSLQRNNAVVSFNVILTSQLDLEVLTQQALSQLIDQTQSSAGAILIENEGALQVTTSQGIRTPERLTASDHVRRALRSEKRQRLALPFDVVLEGVLTDFRPAEVVVDPIIYKMVPLGVVVLAGSRPYEAEALTRLDLFQPALALALNNALIHDRLQRLAAVDPLTGIYNRRFGLARLKEEFKRSVRQTNPLGLLLFDLDHFKNINDTYGHLVGDRILIRIAKTAQSVMREGDILLRFGGEEFLAVLPGASKEDAREIGERIRRKVEETSLVDGDQTIRVTISVGVSAFPELDVEDENRLIDLADQALYAAKTSGRNRVVAA